MASEAIKILDDSYALFRTVFDRHFASLQEAHEVESRAVAGDDRAMVRLWKLYQDASFEEVRWEEVSGFLGRRELKAMMARVVSLPTATALRQSARQAHNVEVLSFPESVALGHRDPCARYVVYRHEKRQSDPTEPVGISEFLSPIVLQNPHWRYNADEWWDGYSRVNPPNALHEDFVSMEYAHGIDTYARYVSARYNRAIPLLEECARAGSSTAPVGLHEIYTTQVFSFHDTTKIFNANKTLPNPFCDLGRANYWHEVARFLRVGESERVLDSLILSQDTTAEGLYNIGVALFVNTQVRAAYNKRIGKPLDDFAAANDFIKHAANLGSANAAWFFGDLYQANAEHDSNNTEKLRAATFWYKIGADLGHPNAKHRFEYLTRRDQSLAVPGFPRAVLTSPSKDHLRRYPAAAGEIEISHYDYSFLGDAHRGALLERIHRARQLSEQQVAEFDRIVKSLETKVEFMLRDAAGKTAQVADIDRQREEGFARNTGLQREMNAAQRRGELARDRWYKEQAANTAAGLAVFLATGGAAGGISVARAAGYGAAAANEMDYHREMIANLTAQLRDIPLLDAQRIELEAEVRRIMELRSMTALRRDQVAVNRLMQGYLRLQVLELAEQNCEFMDRRIRAAGINSIDTFLESFRRDGSRGLGRARIHQALQSFCLGVADTNDLHIMMATSDLIGKRAGGDPAARHEMALHKFVEDFVKPSIDDYAAKSSRIDVLKSAQFNLAPDAAAMTRVDVQMNTELGVLMKENFASEGSLDINRIFAFYLHRHGKRDLRPTRLNDGLPTNVSEPKRVTIWNRDQREEFIERTIEFYRHSSQDLPSVDSIFLRICAAEYFEPQSVITSGRRATFRENPQAPIAYPMVNDVINHFVEQMNLGPVGRYYDAMNERRALDALVAQSLIDFFAALGQTHTKQFVKERDDLARAYGMQAYGPRFRDCCEVITDDAREQYALFKDIFTQNLQKTLEISRAEDSDELLKQLEEVKALGARGLDPKGIVMPGTPEALKRAIDRKDRRFENMCPPASNRAQ